MRQARRMFAWALVLAVLVLALTPVTALAAKTSYKTWTAVAEAMGEVLDGAYDAYVGGDADAAYKGVNGAYRDYYEALGFERTTLGFISGGRKTKVEGQFSRCKAIIRKGGSAEELRAAIDELEAMVLEDGARLDGTWEGGEESAFTSAAEAKSTAESVIETLTEYQAVLAGTAGEGAMTTKEDAAESIDMLVSMLESYTGELGGLHDTLKTSYDSIGDLDAEGVGTLIATITDYAGSLGNAESSGESAGGSGKSAGWTTFAACFAIIVREGVEAILVVGAIIAYLVKTGNKDKLRPVYAGSLLAIIASFLLAWLLSLIKSANDIIPQEVVEGVTALIAVVVLFYVSNWMVSKSESAVWGKYIEGKVSSSVQAGSAFALGFTAFLAVFREGAEVILFYQQYLGDGYGSYVWGGFAAGCVVLAVVYLLIRYLSVKLPLKPFFLATSILMAVMAISFLGNGINELIEGNVITESLILKEFLESFIPTGSEVLTVLGIFPTIETLLPQIILLIITIVTFVIQMKRNKRARLEMEAAAK